MDFLHKNLKTFWYNWSYVPFCSDFFSALNLDVVSGWVKWSVSYPQSFKQNRFEAIRVVDDGSIT